MKLFKVQLLENDYPKAIEIWENAVIATHSFLKEKDRIELKREIPKYFSHVEAYLWFYEEQAIGFSGTNEQHLEMLFIDPKYFNQGFGTEILQYLIKQNKIQYVDVNKDNKKATQFYIKNGFELFKTSRFDSQGRDYPILHLKLGGQSL